MRPDPNDRISDLYHAALERAPEERSAFLQTATDGDEILRQEVESLLAYTSASPAFLAEPVIPMLDTERAHVDLVGRRLGPYTILSPLGAGGMGHVYRARDSKLARDVAIKVLPPDVTAVHDRAIRFAREARLLATLNHPHIGAIYGLEESDGLTALILELVEGPTLAERLEHGPLPLSQALAIARQIAAALEAAHAKGIVHRDLKPANIVLQDATSIGGGSGESCARVLDFGLAKAMARGVDARERASSSASPDETIEGMVLGTPAYMSPEQARGESVDKRTDLWAFGCVLFEMLTGRRLFEGKTATDTIARVLERDPDWAALPAATPPSIRRLLRRCLEKDSQKRLRDVADACLEFDDVYGLENEDHRSRQSRTSLRLPWIIAGSGVVLAALAAFAWLQPREAAPPLRALQFSVEPPPQAMFGNQYNGFSVSPDGLSIAVSAATAGSGGTMLWVRRLDSLSATPLAGSERGSSPFWSPDSRSLAFFADGRVRRIDIGGGPPVDLCGAIASGTAPGGGTWNNSGVILLGGATGIQRVSASGGTPVPVTTVALASGETGHGYPQFLPGGDAFLYFVASADRKVQGMHISSLSNPGLRRQILRTASKAVYVPPNGTFPGVLLWMRDQTLMSQQFDTESARLLGTPLSVATEVSFSIYNSRPAFWASDNGVLAYFAGSPFAKRRLVWVDRSGKELGDAGPEGAYWNLALSRDAGRVALSKWGPTVSGEANLDVWLLEFSRGMMTQLTFEPQRDGAPAWSRDGKQIAFASAREQGVAQVYLKSVDGEPGDEQRVTTGTGYKTPSDWSRDGKYILYNEQGNVMAVPLDGEGKPIPVAQTSFEEAAGIFSPDGKWITYAADYTGRFEVYAKAFSPQGATARQLQISTSGGFMTRWRDDSQELYYESNGKIMAVMFRPTAEGIQPEPARELFSIGSRLGRNQQFDVTPDGQRFLMILTPDATPEMSRLTVISNWQALVHEQAATRQPSSRNR